MKKLLLVALLLVGSLTYAHESSKEEKKIVYDYINLQLKQGKITQKEAQKMWLEYTQCCK